MAKVISSMLIGAGFGAAIAYAVVAFGSPTGGAIGYPLAAQAAIFSLLSIAISLAKVAENTAFEEDRDGSDREEGV